MSIEDQTLLQFMQEKLARAQFTVAPEDTLKSFGYTDQNVAKAEIFVIKLAQKPEDGELAALIATYLIKSGYDVTIKRDSTAKTILEPEEAEVFKFHFTLLASSSSEKDPLPECLVLVNHNDLVASIRKTDTQL
jgi:hypothetical protein